VHDITGIEARGIPGVFIASHIFGEAAAAQARALGAEPAAVYIPHPIQDRTDDEMRALADDAVTAILRAICTAPPAIRAEQSPR
jgi:hypothetical protein